MRGHDSRFSGMKHVMLGLAFFNAGSVLALPPLLSDQEVLGAAARVDAAVKRVVSLQSDPKLNANAPPAPATSPIDDLTYLRRACIDLCGRLPRAEEASAFANDTAPDKRSRLRDRLLNEPAAAEWRFQRLAEALRITDDVGGTAQEPYQKWLRRMVAEDPPADQWMARLLAASGTLQDNPAAGFLLRDQGLAPVTASEVARAFLGEDIHCAGCHDHPFNDHTQRRFYEFAACFNFVSARSGAGRPLEWEAQSRPLPLRLPADYLYRDGRPGDLVPRRFLPLHAAAVRQADFTEPIKEDKARELLALWFTSEANASFRSMMALRVYDWMFGLQRRGIPERLEAGYTDPETPAQLWRSKGCGEAVAGGLGSWQTTHQEFVADLRREFEACGCRIGELQRILASTQAYQRQALAPDPMGLVRILPAPVLRRLPSEVLWDAIVTCLPSDQQQGLDQRSGQLPQVPPRDHPLRIMGRGTRQWADESRAAISHELARVMMASPVVTRAAASAPAAVDDLFLNLLTRRPSDPERTAAAAHLTAHPKSGAADLAWALLNTTEFLFWH